MEGITLSTEDELEPDAADVRNDDDVDPDNGT
jgi:hypothetical protein